MGSDRREPVALHERAADNLRFIRDAMERSGSFTAVPGVGGMAMGAVALVAAFLAPAARVQGPLAWLRVWLIALVVAVLLCSWALVVKARRSGTSLVRGAARKFALNMLPALVAGALLSVALVRWGRPYSLPGVWMLLYGVGVAAGGAFSVRIVPVVGVLFMVSGGVTLFLPEAMGDFMMALTFGAWHLGFGWLVARRHGG